MKIIALQLISIKISKHGTFLIPNKFYDNLKNVLL